MEVEPARRDAAALDPELLQVTDLAPGALRDNSVIVDALYSKRLLLPETANLDVCFSRFVSCYNFKLIAQPQMVLQDGVFDMPMEFPSVIYECMAPAMHSWSILFVPHWNLFGPPMVLCQYCEYWRQSSSTARALPHGSTGFAHRRCFRSLITLVQLLLQEPVHLEHRTKERNRLLQTMQMEVLAKDYWGDPRETLCDTVADLKVGFFVLGCKGLGPLKRALLGSVGNYVVNNATCTVTVLSGPTGSSA